MACTVRLALLLCTGDASLFLSSGRGPSARRSQGAVRQARRKVELSAIVNSVSDIESTTQCEEVDR
jgi:hypothetical protein